MESPEKKRRRASLAGTNLFLDVRTNLYVWRRTDERTGKRFKRGTGTPNLEIALKNARDFEDEYQRGLAGIETYDSWRLDLRPLADAWIEALRQGTACEPVVNAKKFRISRVLDEWNLKTPADLDNVTKLNDRLLSLARKGVRRSLLREGYQQPLRQFSAWLAANKRYLEYDPLAAWKALKDPERGTRRRRRAFLPEEVARALLAAERLGATRRRTEPQRPLYTALLVTGARTGALLERTIQDLDKEKPRISLGPDVGNKHRGYGALDPQTSLEIVSALRDRTEGALFLSPDGKPVRIERLLDQWREAFGLGLVDALWPESVPRDFHVAYLVNLTLLDGRVRANRGGNPKLLRQETIARRDDLERRVLEIVEVLREPWRAKMKGVDVYALRKTHRTWAELQGVPAVLIDKQLGHSSVSTQGANEFVRALLGSDTGRKHYLDVGLDLFDAGRSARAVRALLEEGLTTVLNSPSCLTGIPEKRAQPAPRPSTGRSVG